MGIPGNFPEGAIGVAEVTGVPSPIGIYCRFGDLCSCLCGLAQNGVNFGPGTDIMRKCDPAKPLPVGRDLRIQGEFFQGKKSKPRSPELEKPYSRKITMERKTEPIPVKRRSSRQIGYAKGDHADSWFHVGSFLKFEEAA
jgi:hypothetical protein